MASSSRRTGLSRWRMNVNADLFVVMEPPSTNVVPPPSTPPQCQQKQTTHASTSPRSHSERTSPTTNQQPLPTTTSVSTSYKSRSTPSPTEALHLNSVTPSRIVEDSRTPNVHTDFTAAPSPSSPLPLFPTPNSRVNHTNTFLSACVEEPQTQGAVDNKEHREQHRVFVLDNREHQQQLPRSKMEEEEETPTKGTTTTTVILARQDSLAVALASLTDSVDEEPRHHSQPTHLRDNRHLSTGDNVEQEESPDRTVRGDRTMSSLSALNDTSRTRAFEEDEDADGGERVLAERSPPGSSAHSEEVREERAHGEEDRSGEAHQQVVQRMAPHDPTTNTEVTTKSSSPRPDPLIPTCAPLDTKEKEEEMDIGTARKLKIEELKERTRLKQQQNAAFLDLCTLTADGIV